MQPDVRVFKLTRSMLTMLSAVALMLMASSDLYAQQTQQTRLVETVGAFFGTPPGTVAFLPAADTEAKARATWRYRVFGQDGAYRIPNQADCWFIVNHRDTAVDQGDVTYVGVQMLLFKEWEQVEPLYVFRNQGWLDNGDVDESVRLDELQETVSRDIWEFVQLHEQDDLTDLHQFLGFAWHATPTNDDQSSWDRRVNWAIHNIVDIDSTTFTSSFDPPMPDGLKASFQSYLIKFATTHRVNSDRPVIFNFDCQNATYVWLRTFSPNNRSFTHQYYLYVDGR